MFICLPRLSSTVSFWGGTGSFLLHYPHLSVLKMLMKMSECKDGDQNIKIEQMFLCRVLVWRNHLRRAFLHASFPLHTRARKFTINGSEWLQSSKIKRTVIMEWAAALCKKRFWSGASVCVEVQSGESDIYLSQLTEYLQHSLRHFQHTHPIPQM